MEKNSQEKHHVIMFLLFDDDAHVIPVAMIWGGRTCIGGLRNEGNSGAASGFGGLHTILRARVIELGFQLQRLAAREFARFDLIPANRDVKDAQGRVIGRLADNECPLFGSMEEHFRNEPDLEVRVQLQLPWRSKNIPFLKS